MYRRTALLFEVLYINFSQTVSYCDFQFICPHCALTILSPPLLIRGQGGDSHCEVWHDLCKLVCLSELEMKHNEVPPSRVVLTVNQGFKKSLSLKNQSSAVLIQEIKLRKFVKSTEFSLHHDCRDQIQYQQRITAIGKGSLIAQPCLMYSTSDYKQKNYPLNSWNYEHQLHIWGLMDQERSQRLVLNTSQSFPNPLN